MRRGKPLRRRTPLRSRLRRNDSAWRRECLERRGPQCRVTGCWRMDVQMDHLIPRSQGGPSVVENGLPLCREHHEMKTAHDLRVDPAWLGEDQILWLSDEGHAEWLLDGVVVGRHRKLFADGPDRRDT
jgi:HNH endonuclease